MTPSIVLLASAFLGAEPTPARAHLPTWPVFLQTSVVQLTRHYPGELALFVEDVRSGETYGYNADTPMYLASGIKIPVMVALYDAVVSGELSLDETLLFQPSDVRDGAPLLNYVRPGTPISIGVLLEAMIRSSDNAATDMIIRRIGLDRVNEVLPREGVHGFGPVTSLLDVRRLVYRQLDPRAEQLSYRDIFRLGLTTPIERRVRTLEEQLDLPAETFSVADYHAAFDSYYLEGWNSASMRAMGLLLAEMVRGRIISPDASEKMLQVMLGTRSGTQRFRAGFPASIRFAHKTGTQNRRTCDFGVVFLPPDRRPVVVAASIIGTRPGSERLLQKLAAAIYRVFRSDRNRPARKPGMSLGSRTNPR